MKTTALLSAMMLIALIFIPMFSAPVAVAENAGTSVNFDDYESSEVYKFVQYFSETYPSRIAGSDTERQAALYIKQCFEQILEGTDSSVELQSAEQSSNVVATLNSAASNEYRIIIGAHYDSVLGSEGAQDNASGVAALLEIARQLASYNLQLPVDVVFIAFGGEEAGLIGSYGYVGSMTSADVQRTLMMINLDSIAGGDYLYLHCETVANDMERFFVDNFATYSEISVKPYTNGVVAFPGILGDYYEKLQASDQTPFRAMGIPTALFISGNYKTFSWDYVESADESYCVMNSNRDTFDNLNRRKEEFVKKILTVSDTIVSVIKADGFRDMAINARSGLVNLDVVYSQRWPVIARIAITLILAFVAWRYYRSLRKKSYMSNVSAGGTGNKVFTSPQVDDVFDL